MSVVDINRAERIFASYAPEADRHTAVDAYHPGDGDLPPIPAWITEAALAAEGGAVMPMVDMFGSEAPRA